MPTQGLPGGRGPKFGPDGEVIQDEAFDARRQRLPKADCWMLANDDLYDDAHLGVVLASASTTYFSWCRPPGFAALGAQGDFVKSRIVVFGATAATTLTAGVYLFTPETLEIALVPGSEVTFSAAATGLIERPVAFSLASEGRYLIGFVGSSVSPTFRGMNAPAASRLVPGYTFSASALPKRLLLSQATKSYTMATISVAYLSAQAARVL